MTAASTRKKSLVSIETARGVAAILVVLYHACRHIEKEAGTMPFASAFQFGHTGVDFFFVISGFIIYFIHSKDLGKPSALPNYLYRRVTRIFPLFWFALLIAIALSVATGKALPGVEALIVDALLLPGDSLVGVSWTLRSEMVFYLFFCLLLLFSQNTGHVLCAIWAGVLVSANYIAPGSKSIFLSSYNLQFLMGVAVAWIVLNHAFSKRACVALLIGAVGIFVGVGITENMGVLDGYGDPARLLYGIPAAVIVLAAAQLDRYHAVKPLKIGLFLGSVSYSIYLVHFFGIGIANKVMDAAGVSAHLNGEVEAFLLALAGMGAGIVVGLLVERPLQNWFRKPRIFASLIASPAK